MSHWRFQLELERTGGRQKVTKKNSLFNINKTTYSWWIYKPSKKLSQKGLKQLRKLWKKLEKNVDLI